MRKLGSLARLPWLVEQRINKKSMKTQQGYAYIVPNTAAKSEESVCQPSIPGLESICTMSRRGVSAPLAVQMESLKKSMSSRDQRRNQERMQRVVRS